MCKGKGKIATISKYYRVFRVYDDGPQDSKEFIDLHLARKYMYNHKDSTYKFMLVAPDGTIL